MGPGHEMPMPRRTTPASSPAVEGTARSVTTPAREMLALSAIAVSLEYRSERRPATDTATTESATAPAIGATGQPFASRSVSPRYVDPEGTVTVRVTLPEIVGRVVLEESPPGDPTIESVSPEPVDRAAADGRVTVAWECDEPTEATVEYSLPVADVAAGEALVFEGEALLPDHVATVAGRDAVPVVADFVDRIVADRPVTTADLRDAGRQFETGAITATDYERVYHAWLDERASGGGERNG
jgi:hypothetical protein